MPSDNSDTPLPPLEAAAEVDSSTESNAEPPGAYRADPMIGVEVQCEATRLMTIAQGGDHEAFEDLFRHLRGRAFQVARSLVGSREDALDLTQEAFAKVYSARDSYDPGQPFLPWFHRILRNACFSLLRKRGRVRRRSLFGVDGDGEELELELEDPGPPPSAGVELEERADLFQRALGRLSSRDREILALRHFEELSYKEIAAALGIPEGTVMSRLFHARRRLRDALGPHLAEELGGHAK